MTLNRYAYILLFWIISLAGSAYSQLVTNSSQTPAQLVQNTLIGGGVTVTNIQYTGASEAIGYFNGSASNIGLNEGIIITTGTVSGNAEGPIGPNNTGDAGMDNGAGAYALLQNTSGASSTHNAAILEFDFVPTSDTLQFRFVFASEEYPEYVCSGFNDVFAFYISGPNPLGGNYNSQNLALVPGTNIPVAINNVNNGNVGSEGDGVNCSASGLSNSIYYVNNSTNPPSNAVQYDGFTVPITAFGNVICGETYHMVFAIADAIDPYFDSGIFLEANSFDTPTSIVLSGSTTGPGSIGSQTGISLDLSEGCTVTTISFQRNSANISDLLTIPLNVSGSAVAGVDYTNLPGSITFQPGQSVVTLTLDAFEDFITEGIENVVISIDFPDPCGNSNIQQVELFISDVEPVILDIPDYDIACPGDTITAFATVNGGYPDYSISWDNQAFGIFNPSNGFDISPSVTTDYTVKAFDVCIGDTVQETFRVNVPVFGPIVITDILDETTGCPFTNFTFNGLVSGGSGNYNYSWNGSGISQFTFSDAPETTTSYTLEITDNCGNYAIDDFTIVVTGTILTPHITDDTLICPGDTMELYVYATGGQGSYTYYWEELGATEQTVFVWPQYTTTYIVKIEDSCHTYTIYDTVTVEVVRPIADFSMLSNDNTQGLQINFINTSQFGNYWFWDLGNGDTSIVMHPNTVYDSSGWYSVFLRIENEIGCWDTITKRIYIKPEVYLYIPNSFTPNGDGMNDYFSVSSINAVKFEFLIFNRWGELIYETKDKYFQWDGSYKGERVPLGVYVYQIYIEDIREEHTLKRGHIVVLE